MKAWNRHLPGIIVTAIFVIAAVFFLIVAVGAQLFPGSYLALGTAALVLFAAGVGLLVWDFAYRGRFFVGSALSVILTTVLVVAGVYLQMTVSALRNTSNVQVQTANVGIFVPTESAAQSLADLQDSQFGVLSELDRENTDKTLIELSDDLGKAPYLKEYPGLTQLIDGLLTTQEVDAIVLNTAYLELFDEMEGYEGVESRLRQIDLRRVETEIVVPESTPAPEGTASPAETLDKIYTIYISGSDTRYGLNTVGRSDVNILAVVNTSTKQVLLVSTPRDYYVPLSISNGVPDKLTHAGIYGIDVSIGTIEMLYDLDIDYYFRLNFTGFVDIVDALGGVTVYNDIGFTREGFTYNEGYITLNGAQALGFARERYSFTTGDVQRGINQMRLISGILRKALSPDILTRYTSILQSVDGAFEMNIPYDEIAAVVRNQLDTGGDWSIVRYNVTGWNDSQIPYSMSQYAYVMQPDYATVDKAKELIARVKNGERLTDEDTGRSGDAEFQGLPDAD